MNGRPIVEASGLTKHFDAVAAVDGLSFTVDRGEIFGLVGPDGAGKTTTMRMLAGVMQPDAGSIVIDGIDVVSDPEEGKQHISYMPQRFGLYEDLTVDENIRFYADLFEVPPSSRVERAERLLAASGMSQFRSRLAGQLSGGMKQKLGLTCALVHTPRNPAARRTDHRRRPGLASRFLAHSLRPARGRCDHPHLDRLSR